VYEYEMLRALMIALDELNLDQLPRDWDRGAARAAINRLQGSVVEWDGGRLVVKPSR
jgi:hypothetical protein